MKALNGQAMDSGRKDPAFLRRPVAAAALAASSCGVYLHIYMIIKKRQTVKSDRLIVLLAPDEKARIVALARARQTSVGELVRSALARLQESPSLRDRRPARTIGARPPVEIPTNGEDEQARQTAEQATALERLAEIALHRMQKANAALDQAFAEIEATKAHFAAKRRAAPPA